MMYYSFFVFGFGVYLHSAATFPLFAVAQKTSGLMALAPTLSKAPTQVIPAALTNFPSSNGLFLDHFPEKDEPSDQV